MKSKFKIILIIATIAISIFGASAQGLYFKLGGGYNLPMAGSTYYTKSIFNSSSSPDNGFTTETKQMSLGKGFSGSGAIGYIINKNIGFECGITYLSSAKYLNNSQFITNSATINYDNTLSSSMLRIVPSVVISTDFEKINFYSRFGLAIGLMNKVVNKMVINDPAGVGTGENQFSMYGGFPLGIDVSGGVTFSLSKKISIFGELSTLSMSYAPKRGKYDYLKVNGADIISSQNTASIEEEYVDKISPDDNRDQSVAHKVEKIYFPLSSIGFNVGLKFNL